MSKKSFIILIMIIFFSLNTYTIFSIHGKQKQNPFQITKKMSFSPYDSPHNPLNIANNSELASIAISGDGSSTSPYMIENLIINNCSENETGIKIQNTNKYFIIENMTVSGCQIGISFSHVSFGTIRNSFVTNFSYIGYFLSNSSNNNLIDNMAINGSYDPIFVYDVAVGFSVVNFNCYNNLVNNTVNNSHSGIIVANFANYNNLTNNKVYQSNQVAFRLYNSSFNILTDNIVNKYYVLGFEIEMDSNIILLNNIVTNGNWGFYVLGGSNNTLLKDNIGFNNVNDFIIWDDSFNTTLISNNFVLYQYVYSKGGNSFGYFYALPLISYTSFIVVIFLIGIYFLIVYNLYYFNKRKKNTKESNEDRKSIQDVVIFVDWKSNVVLAGLMDVLFIAITLFPATSYFTLTFYPWFEGAQSSSKNIFQLAPLVGILLLGSAIVIITSVALFVTAKTISKVTMAEKLAFIGLTTQVIAFLLTGLVYIDIINTINYVKNILQISSSASYVLVLGSGPFFCFFGLLIASFMYLTQRQERNECFKKLNVE